VSLTPGTRLGSYDIVALLGAGGMGEVYRARDTKLNRAVAIKVLLPAVANDPDRLARFSREAQVLASLNHPNIAHIHGLEEAAGVTALVLELVEGEDLAQRLTRGPIPLDDALPIARQIADALEAAHEQGIIHRDLKPANIKVRPDGTVKVLDFGLAKAMDPAGVSSANAMNSPTLSMHATQAGIILGTAAYMSPEQARGKSVDRRADIWAFGVVLFEMITGRRAFDGETITDVVAAVVTRDPAWSLLPAETPAAIRTLLRRCLAKAPEKRLPHIGIARLEMDEAIANPEASDSAAVPRRPSSGAAHLVSIGVAIAMAAAMVSGGAVWLLTRRGPVTRSVVRLQAALRADTPLAIDPFTRDLAFSPDGTRLAYIAGGSTQLYLRALDQSEATPVAGIVGVRGPFFSPDSEWVAFFQQGDLKKVSVRGGPAATICQNCAAGNRGATWGPDEAIIFSMTGGSSGLLRVPAGGGQAVALAKPDAQKGEQGYVWPEFLPGGQAVLFTILSTGSIESSLVAVYDLKTRTQHTLVRGGSHAHFVPPGYLVYAVAGTLRAAAFDRDSLTVAGNATTVLEHVLTKATGGADFSVSRDGSLAYVSGEAESAQTLAWADRQGHEESLGLPPRAYVVPRLSPDGQRIALDIRDQENDIWIWDLAKRVLTRLTFDRAPDQYPVWTPDGRRIAFASFRAGAQQNVFVQSADGTGAVERLTTSKRGQFPLAITPDGKSLLIREAGIASQSDLNVVSMQGDHGSMPLINTAFTQLNADISRDGHWLAYQSNESGRDEVHVRPYPNIQGGHWQISTGGGTRPVWARSGRELFYVDSLGHMTTVPIEASQTFSAGNPVALPQVASLPTSGLRNYDVSLDGRRFLIITNAVRNDGVSNPIQLNLVLNWGEELQRLVPAGQR
jgi:serine/threonine-protein kinase